MDNKGFEMDVQDISGANGARLRSASSIQSDAGTESTDDGQDVGLKKRVGLVSGTALIVGTMIGSGIFISPKGVLEGSGSVGLSLVSWTICGIISTFGALSLAELGTLIPLSGGEYVYMKTAFGDVMAYMVSFTSVIMLKPSSIAIITLTCAEYILVPLMDDGCPLPIVEPKMLAAVVIILITWVNCYSVRLAARIQVIFTAAKLVALVVIIIGGIVRLGQGYTDTLGTGFDGTESNVGNIAIGLYSGMWAYDGWNNLNYVTEEIQNPNKNLPRSIMIGIPSVMVLYILVNISYFTVMSVPELLDSPAVAITWADAVIGDVSWIMPIFVALSTFGAANGSLFSGGRLTYVAAREGHMVELLSMIHVKRYTPIPSLILSSIIAIIMCIPGNIAGLIDFFSFAVWMFYGMTVAAVVVLRFTMKDAPRPYKVPIVLPIITSLVSAYLVVAPIIDAPQIEFLYAAIFMVGGFLFYVPFVHFKKVFPGMGAFTKHMQMFMQVASPNYED